MPPATLLLLMCPAGSSSHVPQAAPWHGDLLRVKKCASSLKLSRAPQAAVDMRNTVFILRSCVLHGPKLCPRPVQSCLTFAVLPAAALACALSAFAWASTNDPQQQVRCCLVLYWWCWLCRSMQSISPSMQSMGPVFYSLPHLLLLVKQACSNPFSNTPRAPTAACTRGTNCYRPAGGSAAPAPCTSLCCSVIGLL